MQGRISHITFPTDQEEIARKKLIQGHTEYGQFYYYKTFGKTVALYRLLSNEKGISDEQFAQELKKAMQINGNGDCAVSIDRRGRYKNEVMSAKKYTGLKKLMVAKIQGGNISKENAYYLLCRISDNSDLRGETKIEVERLLSNPAR